MRNFWTQLAIATNWPVLAAVGVLSFVGVISVWGHSPDDGRKQLAFLGVALACMVAAQTVSYVAVGRLAWGFYIGSALLILYTVIGSVMTVPGVRMVNGAYNWIDLGVTKLQPAELMKLGFCMVMARYLRFRSNYRTFAGLLAPFGLMLFPVALILKQPDLGTALTFIPALFVMLFVAGAKIRHLLFVVLLGLCFAPLLYFAGQCKSEGCQICPSLPVLRHLPQFVKHYQRERVFAMFSEDPAVLQDAGYQQEHAIIALASGGAGGKGLGNIPVGRYVPESHNDMVFALVGEQFGFWGVAVVLAAYVVLFAAGLEIAASTREPFGKLVAVGVVTLLAGQAFLNIMVALRLFPVTGVTLPFVSYGGSSLVSSFLAAGLLLNIGQNRPIVMARDSFEFD
ncbi:MAG TPA: FtsW/RodA/SpoVE family cell cycle protein [Tepidisphaeraceae bacterium]|nr:FtsW/RodA/SpoVE family cell cycle protein [Tepidisphaeraceae bacterium]